MRFCQSNHYHLVLHVNEVEAQSWDTKTVIERWYELFKGNFLVDKYRSGEALSQAELNVVSDCANVWQKRLQDISWYMRCLNEAIAREANKEDGCRGRFWEGRFKSQALLDETALLTCMMYVDLNPIRAGMTETLESSDFTSIQERIFAYAKNLKKAQQQIAKQKKPKGTNLFPFLGGEREHDKVGIAYSLVDYFALIDWTGRAVRSDKNGVIPTHIRPLLHKLHINEDEWLHGITDFGQCFGCALGSQAALKQYSANLGKNWLQGVKAGQRFYRAA